MRRKWTEKEIQYMTKNYPHEKTEVIAKHLKRSIPSVYNAARTIGLSKSEDFLNDYKKSGRCRMVEFGKPYRFKKGNKSWNKGKKVGTRGRMAESQFKKGHLPHNTKEDGAISIRYSKDRPYKWIRLSLGKWELLHREVWRAYYGKIPKGYNVQFKDGNSLNCDIKNLHLVSRQKNMKQNTIHNYPGPIKKTIRTIQKLNKAIKDAKK